MIITGRIQNGVVVLESGIHLPEGCLVQVVCAPPAFVQRPEAARVRVPLVPSKRPGSVNLTGAQISKLLEDDNAAT